MKQNKWSIIKTDTSEKALASASSVFTISNGYLALKGNLLENRSELYSTTILAGVFDEADMVAFIRPTKYKRRYLDPEYFDDATPSPSVANLPDPLYLRVFIGNQEISFRRAEISNFRQEYDLRSGVYAYQYECKTSDGKHTLIEMMRFCDMQNVHRVLMHYSITPINYSGQITIRSGIDGSIRSNLQKDKQFNVIQTSIEDGLCRMHARTKARGIDINLVVCNVTIGIEPATREHVIEDDSIYEVLNFDVSQGQALTIEKHMAISSSEDTRHEVESEPASEVKESVKKGFASTLATNQDWWAQVWDRIDVQIEGDDLAQLYLRFCLFHLMSAAPRHTDKLSVPCKLLTGEHYQGTTFYDTDLYIEPFYLFTFPEIARSCLNYRYLGLENGRKIAKSLGYEGAKFAWQSGPYGEEALGKWWRFTHTNIHIDGDVAYSLMQYWYATKDMQFMLDKGIDILIESSRFYVSRAVYDETSGAYDLLDVAGPDEGHCESKNNFYTNWLAKKTLLWAVKMLDMVQREHPDDYQAILKRLAVQKDESDNWQKVADRLRFYFDDSTKIYEQCEGFYQLAPIPQDLLDNRKVWFVTVFPYQALNQPDVVMAMVLFRNEFSDDVKRANWEFYKEKSMDFSSMSFVINSMMATDMGELDYSYKQFTMSAGGDVDEGLVGRFDTADGIHGTASGGAWMAAVLGFGGINMTENGLIVNPKLPKHWKSLNFKLSILGNNFDFEITSNKIDIGISEHKQLALNASIAGHMLQLVSGQRYSISL